MKKMIIPIILVHMELPAGRLMTSCSLPMTAMISGRLILPELKHLLILQRLVVRKKLYSVM